MIASSGVPDRPDAPGAVRPVHRWLPTAMVTVAMSVTVLGGFVVAETLPAPEVGPVTLGGVLTIHPLPGWEAINRQQATVPSPTGGVLRGEFAQLTRGSGALDLLTLSGVDIPALELADVYAVDVLESQLERLSVSDLVERLTLRSGLKAVRFGYIGSQPQTGAPIEGSVTVAVAPSGNGVVFDGWAFQGQLELFAEELARMVEGAEVA